MNKSHGAGENIIVRIAPGCRLGKSARDPATTATTASSSSSSGSASISASKIVTYPPSDPNATKCPLGDQAVVKYPIVDSEVCSVTTFVNFQSRLALVRRLCGFGICGGEWTISRVKKYAWL
jgi:hypothetical protein